jgi:hypothetical protein
MAVVETTTIRVRRSTQQRLAEEAKLAGVSVMELLDNAADVFEEERLLESFERCYEKHGEAIMAEMQWWLDLPGPPLPDDDWSDVIPEDD